MHSTETLKTLLSQGAGIRIDAKSVGINPLNELAVTANSHNAQLTVFNASSLLKDTIERLAVMGGAHIAFEFLADKELTTPILRPNLCLH